MKSMQTRKKQSQYEPILTNPVIRWISIAAFWIIFGCFMSFQSYYISLRSGEPASLGDAFLSEMMYAALWALLTPVIMRLAWKYPVGISSWLPRGFLHVVASVVIAICQKATFHIVYTMITSTPQNPFSWARVGHGMFLYLDYGLMIYWGLLFIQHAHDYFRRYHQNELEKSHLESQLMRAQLQALKMQLQPHFLFNTLNAISVLVQKNPEAARTMIVKLSDLLRLTLEKNSTQEVPLREELEILDSYLHIEQTRFEDRLEVEREIQQTALDAMVPALLLQPIVENAIHHGVARQRKRAKITIKAEKLNGSLVLQIRDNGPGLDFSHPINDGIGLSNTRQRLLQLYGENAKFDIQNANDGGAVVTITVPYRTTFS